MPQKNNDNFAGNLLRQIFKNISSVTTILSWDTFLRVRFASYTAGTRIIPPDKLDEKINVSAANKMHSPLEKLETLST